MVFVFIVSSPRLRHNIVEKQKRKSLKGPWTWFARLNNPIVKCLSLVRNLSPFLGVYPIHYLLCPTLWRSNILIFGPLGIRIPS